MVKRGLLLIVLYVVITGFTTIPKEDTNNINNLNNINKNYSIVKKKINLLPIVPYSILGLNSYLYKDSYLITITPIIKEYSWLIDTIKLDKKLLKSKDYTTLPGADIPVNLYLQETIELKISTKLLNKDIKSDNNGNLIISYFIIVNNKKTNKIWLLKDKTVNLNLVNNKTFIITEDIKIAFNESMLNNLEILVCFKQNCKEFDALKKFLYDEKVKNKN